MSETSLPAGQVNDPPTQDDPELQPSPSDFADLHDLATKADLALLSDVATKADVARLNEVATKADLAPLTDVATKADVARLNEIATKADLAPLARVATTDDLSRLQELATQVDVTQLRDLLLSHLSNTPNQTDFANLKNFLATREDVLSIHTDLAQKDTTLALADRSLSGLQTRIQELRDETATGGDRLKAELRTSLDGGFSRLADFSEQTNHDLRIIVESTKRTQAELRRVVWLLLGFIVLSASLAFSVWIT